MHHRHVSRINDMRGSVDNSLTYNPSRVLQFKSRVFLHQSTLRHQALAFENQQQRIRLRAVTPVVSLTTPPPSAPSKPRLSFSESEKTRCNRILAKRIINTQPTIPVVQFIREGQRWLAKLKKRSQARRKPPVLEIPEKQIKETTMALVNMIKKERGWLFLRSKNCLC